MLLSCHMARNYVVDLPGGTATQSVQFTAAGTIKNLVVSIHSAAAGKLEISRLSTSQIGTAQPTRDVLVRLNQSGTAGDQNVVVPLASEKFKIMDLIYFHQTGAGNLGSVSFDA